MRAAGVLVLLTAGLAASIAPSATAAPPAASPPAEDGRIAYVKNANIVTINPDGTGKTVLVTAGANAGPAWSPDGTEIAYVHTDGAGVSDLWVMNADGSDRTRLTSTGGVLAAAPSWSPDGTMLSYGGPCQPGDPDLCAGLESQPVLTVIERSSATGVGEMQLTPPGGCTSETGTVLIDGRTSWSPTGDAIVAYSDSLSCVGFDQFIVRYRPADQSLEIIDMTGAGGSFGTYGNPTFSPDGELLAYDKDYSDVGGGLHVGIKVLRLDGSESFRFKQSEDDRQLAFAPSQTQVALVRITSERILLASPHGRQRSFLTRGIEPAWQPIV